MQLQRSTTCYWGTTTKAAAHRTTIMQHRGGAPAADTKRGHQQQLARSLPRGEGIPEDAHHTPQETPEQWLLAQEHAASSEPHPDEPDKQQQQQQSTRNTVPYLGLEVTPELVAISMGALQQRPADQVSLLLLGSQQPVCVIIQPFRL